MKRNAWREKEEKLYLVVKNLLKRDAMDPELHGRLARYFADDVQRLEKLIQRDLSNWRG